MPRYRFPALQSVKPAIDHRGAKPHPADAYQSALEQRFPHILDAITAMWGFQELNVYFHKLSVNERGEREGFPVEVWEEINILLNIHQTILPTPYL